MPRTADSISEVVRCGLCIGCGLCEAVTRGRTRMIMTAYGSLRPAPVDAFTAEEEAQLLSACPGVAVEPRFVKGKHADSVWGAFSTLRYAWAGDTDLRFRAASGGVLSALGMHLIATEQVHFVLHVGSDPQRPMRSRWVLSETVEEVIANAGSRYGPAAPLAGLITALDRARPFAIIAKPCDLSAVHRYGRTDMRVEQLCLARLAMVCGGQSRLTKSQDVLSEYNLNERELTLFRYRGFGNPGRMRIETRTGQVFEKSYLELWEDETGWNLETRCKLCPDALGEAADIAVADVWPGGAPAGEDAGFNGIVVRSAIGETLVTSAVANSDLVLGETITPRQLDGFQPHQVRKKNALAARFAGLAEAGMPEIEATGLRLKESGQRVDRRFHAREKEATVRRAREGRFSEPLPEAVS